MNFQDHAPKTYIRSIVVQTTNQQINGRRTFKIMDQKLLLKVLVYNLQINKLIGTNQLPNNMLSPFEFLKSTISYP
jgi:hypothetical protein